MIHWVSIWLNDVWRNKFDHETRKKNVRSKKEAHEKKREYQWFPLNTKSCQFFYVCAVFKQLETAWNRRSQNILCDARHYACKRVCSVSGQGEWERSKKKCRLSGKNSHKHLRKRKTINILANLISIRINYVCKKGDREKPSSAR